ncbi:MAG TPA: DNA-directed DNA polymerase II small subunit [Nitrososphaeraceae archaeon]|nr:DNA-directed DNA polymerase II small subunit [Nitrososphaeraceae archaeon]
MNKEISNALSFLTSNGYRMHPDAFAMLKGLDTDILKIVQDIIKIKSKQKQNSTIIIDDIKKIINPESKVTTEDSGISSVDIDIDNSVLEKHPHHKIILDASINVNSGEGVEGYTALFRSRYEKSLRILSLRPESKRITKIASIRQNTSHNSNNMKSDKSYNSMTGNFVSNSTSIVSGLLMSKRGKKNGVEVVIDDFSGSLNALAITDELKKQASMLTLDQMVMLEVENISNKGHQGFLVKDIISPDIPDHLPTRSKVECYAVLISDIHVGSKNFMETEFIRFLHWLSSSEDELVRKIKFICIGGDLVDGVGIFPNQDKELLETDTSKQVSHAVNLLNKIPKDLRVFIIPGNHDPGRRALPQPSLPKRDFNELYLLENFTILGNPSMLELNGVKVLMYHGQSLDDIIATTPGLDYSKPAEAMKILLKARHLSPIYGQRTPMAPELEDMMVITEVPDILHSGHVHVIDVQNYRGTLIVNSGAWQSQTKFQQTMGVVPTPGIAILVNLATLQPYQISFNQPLVM